MATTRRSKRVLCPMYIGDGPIEICCEGPFDLCPRVTLSFRNRNACEQHMTLFCDKDYCCCEVYRMVMEAKYDDDAPSYKDSRTGFSRSSPVGAGHGRKGRNGSLSGHNKVNKERLMADVKWIKLVVNVFNNRKIEQIEVMPDGDGIVVIWFKLLCLAGSINDDGMIYFTKEVPYTEEMLSTHFHRPLALVKLALRVFVTYGMVEIIDNIIHISNWEKYQSVDRLDAIREYNRIAQSKHRQKQKALPAHVNDMSMTNQTCQDTDIDKELDIEVDKSTGSAAAPTPRKHQYGEYSNVLLTNVELDKLQTEIPDWQKMIERLSGYMRSTGKVYKDHLATMRNWKKMDAEKGIVGKTVTAQRYEQRDYDSSIDQDNVKRALEAAGKMEAL